MSNLRAAPLMIGVSSEILLSPFLSLTGNESVASVLTRGAASGAHWRRVSQNLNAQHQKLRNVHARCAARFGVDRSTGASLERGRSLGRAAPSRGSSALQPLTRAWPSLGEHSWAICNLQVLGRVD